MKNGCNFHALQVKSNYKIFSEKIEPKKDACRMAIKIKGKLPLKICSVLSVAGAMLVPVLLLIAGLMGHARADRPNSMKPCFFLGLATGVIILFNVLYEIFTGDAPNMPEICTYVLDLVLPVLYTFCAWLNWRHKGDDTPKAADADPAPASKS